MMKLAHYLKRPIKRALDPYGRSGLRRSLPLEFWRRYASAHSISKGAIDQGIDDSVLSRHSIPTFSADFFQDHLVGNLLPFWASHAIDREHGGYVTHLDRTGCVYDGAVKYAAMQARLVYAFSVSHRRQPASHYLRLAQHGERYLAAAFWDRQHGGWFTSVHADGQSCAPDKNLFHQAYTLIGLTEYYRINPEPAVWDMLASTYDLLEKHAWDHRRLGYAQRLQADWSPNSNAKTICIQLDMLRAVLSMQRATQEPRYSQRALELADAIVEHMCDPHYGCVGEVFHADWRYSAVATHDMVQIGHNLKCAWLLLRVAAIDPNPRYVGAARRMLDFCLRYGWDPVYGGFYQHVYRTGPVALPDKLWWPECEGLTAILAFYERTNDERFWRYFQALTAFIFSSFVDHEYGEWFMSCHRDGRQLDDRKGGTYKSAYHTVQACDQAEHMLRLLADGGSRSTRDGASRTHAELWLT